jgi:hypothetical protein
VRLRAFTTEVTEKRRTKNYGPTNNEPQSLIPTRASRSASLCGLCVLCGEIFLWSQPTAAPDQLIVRRGAVERSFQCLDEALG